MKKAIFIILDQYADWEGAYLSSQLNQREDWEVETASVKNTVHSIGGFTTRVNYQISELPKKIDLLVLIGGNSWSLENSDLHAVINHCLNNAVAVAAICGAVDYLAKEGLLTGYQHTGNAQYLWADFTQYINNQDFQLVQAIRDRNLVTGNGTGTLNFTALTLQMIGFTEQEVRSAVELHRLGYYDYTKKYGNPYIQGN